MSTDPQIQSGQKTRGPMWPAIALMGAGAGLGAYSSYRAGEAAEEAYDDQADQLLLEARFGQKLAIEDMHEVRREDAAATGAVKARISKSGLRMGGSTKGQIDTIGKKTARRLERINMIQSERSRQAWMQAKSLRKTGRAHASAGRMQAYTSLLGSTASIGMTVSEAGGFANIFKRRPA